MIGIVGAGAFGGALAVALGAQMPVTLWGRGLVGRSLARLPGVTLPQTVHITDDLGDIAAVNTLLLALPTQTLRIFLRENAHRFAANRIIACCKGVDLQSGLGPAAMIAQVFAGRTTAILTGPGFATDIAKLLPTALTLACADTEEGEALQRMLSTPRLRLYRSTDVVGAELGGALKNVIAIAAGLVMGAGLGVSARAALMTRGFAEMQRFALARGARAETLAGLSGLGDLVLTCTSDQSRNFRHGFALGAGLAGADLPGADGSTVEGVATARAVAQLAANDGQAMPVTDMVAALTTGRIAIDAAIASLMTRPLREE